MRAPHPDPPGRRQRWVLESGAISGLTQSLPRHFPLNWFLKTAICCQAIRGSKVGGFQTLCRSQSTLAIVMCRSGRRAGSRRHTHTCSHASSLIHACFCEGEKVEAPRQHQHSQEGRTDAAPQWGRLLGSITSLTTSSASPPPYRAPC